MKKSLIILLTLTLCSSAFAKMTKRQFIRVLESVEKVYAPIVKEQGGHLILQQGYDFNTVNALAKRDGDDWIIAFYGGLGKHNLMTEDGLRLIVCHELGHHLGGYPYKLYDDGSERWAAVEGQADYFATNECLKNVFNDSERNEMAVSKFPPSIKKQVNEVCDDNLCKRIAAASLSVISVFNSIRPEQIKFSFNTPDPYIAEEINREHPSLQCRLDTMLAGILDGPRPRCWFP